MSRSFKVIGAIAFVTLLILVAGWFATRPGQAVDVSITFVGYTNQVPGLFAVLLISNKSDVAVSRSTKNWLVEDAATGARVNAWDAVDQRIVPVPRPAYEELEAHESRITFVPTPTNTGPWRAVLWYGPVNWKLRLIEWRAGSYPGRDLVDRVVPMGGIDRQDFRSDVITPVAQTTEP